MPAPAWNDSLDGSTDLLDVAWANMIVAAMNERFFAGSQAITFTARVAGDDGGDSTLWAGYQAAIELRIANYVDSTASIDGTSVANPLDIIQPKWTWAAYCAAKRSGNTWTRKYPREFATLAAATYVDGAAFANGHRARCRADDVVYDRTAGAWVVVTWDPATTAPPIPDTITAYGQAQQDDYIGAWLFTELRDAINEMVAMYIGNPGDLGGLQQTGGGGDAVRATAEGQAAADYAADTPAAFSGVPPFYWCDEHFTGTVYTCTLNSGAAKLIINPDGLAQLHPPATCNIQFWIGAKSQHGQHNSEFDGGGFGIGVENGRKLFETVARAGAATVATAGTCGTLTQPAFPVTAPTGTGDPFDSVRGADSVPWGIARCDVVGGYAYTSST